MSWTLVNQFLNKFNNLKPPREFLQSSIAEIISQKTGVDLKAGNLDIKNGVIYIRVNNPMIKSQIMVCKECVLEEIQKRVGRRAPTDIMFSGA